MTDLTKQKEVFVNAVIAMDARTRRVSAFVILDPTCSTGRLYAGRVILSYPRDGVGRVHAVAWLPTKSGESWNTHRGWASGYGYDKANAAMSGAKFWSIKDQSVHSIPDDGYGWDHHLRVAGYDVIQAV